MWETWVRSLGLEDPLEEGVAAHSSILAWRIPVNRGAWGTAVHAVTKRHDWLTKHSTYSITITTPWIISLKIFQSRYKVI